MVTKSRLRSHEIQDLLDAARASGNYVDAWQGYQSLLRALARQVERPRILEVGGGRHPLLTAEEIAELDCTYTVNDIDAGELALAPDWVERLHGDIADPDLLDADQHHGTYDLIFSLMVFEHVEHPEQAYRNIMKLLATGGIVINFVPTLYALPFVVNRFLPERLTAKMLTFFFPQRNPDATPKFPAYYRWCTTTAKTQRKLDSVGFSATELVPFYGHLYYERIPLLRTIARRFWPIAHRRRWRSTSTFAYILAER